MELIAHITSLGCPKNFVDTEIITASLIKNNIGISPSQEDANILIINTCAFIESARKETAKYLMEALKWRKNQNNRIVVVCGCINRLNSNNICTPLLEKVDIKISPDEVESAGEKIIKYISNDQDRNFSHKTNNKNLGLYLPSASTPRIQLTPAHYAYIKIADGCSNHCSYCAIPSIRGRFRSRPIEDIVKESENFINNDCKELILIAQDSGNYGIDLYGTSKIVSLIQSIERIAKNKQIWLRLMYCHPAHIPDELINLFDKSSILLPYLDLPLQHISDRILRLMNRKINSEHIKKTLDKFHSLKRKIAIRTTFITGFPGETEEDFSLLLDFIKEQKFDRLGAFAYSPEENTEAINLKNRVPAKIAEERLKIIMRNQKSISLRKNKELVGKRMEVIIDKTNKSSEFIGRTKFDAPEIDNIVRISTEKKVNIGAIVPVEIISASAYSLKAQIT